MSSSFYDYTGADMTAEGNTNKPKLSLKQTKLHLDVVQASHYSLESVESMLKVLKAVPTLLEVVEAARDLDIAFKRQFPVGEHRAMASVRNAAFRALREQLAALEEGERG